MNHNAYPTDGTPHGAPAEYSQQPASPERTELVFDDGTINVEYRQPGATIDLAQESFRNDDLTAENPYYIVGETGIRYYISPGHEEGTGVALVDLKSSRSKPRDEWQYALLDGNPPTSVTIGQPCMIPGLGKMQEPVKALIMLKGSKHFDSSVHQERYEGKENPIVRALPKFDAAIETARRTGKLA